ncbi:uncharacterized protein AMSG_00181 [Thecamonas trahens ATCC 50062]|uniref:60S acidic ribosomal protein P1 n=1 Tax=Thecamonas trahens ATCC 50062 TaxID=461836 RepID=A0A0L0D452_THETB|nr:hypothetical protein AMSG_00181 [Thecamonas trahens ATCC 50062]KNC46063.1 hypothetical protein AMSG_00181 [Thecamonas trahens ATCC 50062]|eukprot:XP_013763043.1 hypothetical protein AMSG_00181 [Thecamonas trahens ATCC 50062]
MSNNELACTYATLILHDSGMEITGDNIQSVLDAAGVAVQPFWPNLFAKHVASLNVGELIAGLASASPTAAPAAAAGDAPAAAEAAPEAAPEESDSESDMGFGLFD